MARQTFRKIDGKWQWTTEETSTTPPTPISAAIHQDTLDKPIRNMITGKFYDSASQYKKELPKGVEIVGNEKLSSRPRTIPDRFTEAQVMDAIQKAEAICSDPTKFRDRQNENIERLERHQRLIKNGH